MADPLKNLHHRFSGEVSLPRPKKRQASPHNQIVDNPRSVFGLSHDSSSLESGDITWTKDVRQDG